MVKFELSEEIRQQLIIAMFDYSKSVFAKSKPYNYLNLTHLYNTFRDKTIFSPYNYHDIIFNWKWGEGVEIGWNGHIDGEFYSALIVYSFYDFDENMDEIFLVNRDGDETVQEL